MENDTILVLTSQSIDRMKAQGGSCRGWSIGEKRPSSSARRCKYLVCTWNVGGPFSKPFEAHEHEHGEAFLVAPIADFEPSVDVEDAGDQDIRFTKFARIHEPGKWPRHRNPFTYTTLAELGIELERLTWEPVGSAVQLRTVSSAASPAARDVEPLTIAAAKPRIAACYGVPVEAVEVVIRG